MNEVSNKNLCTLLAHDAITSLIKFKQLRYTQLLAHALSFTAQHTMRVCIFYAIDFPVILERSKIIGLPFSS